MVHSNKLVVALKVNGKFLRDSKDSENNNEVFVPFGTEYSIYLKNLHSERALVDIDVDGESAIKGLVVDAKSYNNYSINWVELERFHKGDNFIGHRFKFIEKTQEISEHRGDGRLPEQSVCPQLPFLNAGSGSDGCPKGFLSRVCNGARVGGLRRH